MHSLEIERGLRENNYLRHHLGDGKVMYLISDCRDGFNTFDKLKYICRDIRDEFGKSFLSATQVTSKFKDYNRDVGAYDWHLFEEKGTYILVEYNGSNVGRHDSPFNEIKDELSVGGVLIVAVFPPNKDVEAKIEEIADKYPVK